MKIQQYMIVEMPKNAEMGDVWINDPLLFNDYNEAFDAFNEKVSTDGAQLKQPKGFQPLRAALHDRDIELWCITKTTELVK